MSRGRRPLATPPLPDTIPLSYIALHILHISQPLAARWLADHNLVPVYVSPGGRKRYSRVAVQRAVAAAGTRQQEVVS